MRQRPLRHLYQQPSQHQDPLYPVVHSMDQKELSSTTDLNKIWVDHLKATLLKFPGFSVQSTPKEGLHSKKGKIYLRHPGYTLFIWRRSLHCHWHNVLSPEEHQTKNSLLLPFCRLRWLWLQFPIIMDQMVDLKCWGPRWKYLNSSQSPRITFMCLSNALNWPMKVRESLRYRFLILTYWLWTIHPFHYKKKGYCFTSTKYWTHIYLQNDPHPVIDVVDHLVVLAHNHLALWQVSAS